MRIVFVCLFLASSLAVGYSWVLKSTHANVIPKLTEDVSLRCFNDGRTHGNKVFRRLTRIRLLKRVSIKPKTEWATYAEILYPNTTQPFLADSNQPGVSASGRLGQVSESFLSVTWSSASDDTIGSYKCEVDGFEQTAGTGVKILTEETTITHHAATIVDVHDIIVQLRKKSDLMSHELQSIDVQHATQRQELEKNSMTNAESAIEDNYFEERHWPTELYALLTDANGCPNTPFSNFSSGSTNVQTETKDRPSHSFPTAFDYKVCTNCGTRNVLQFNFCTSNRAEPRLLWPKGTYCIHPISSKCPSSFSLGYTRFFVESLVNLIVINKNVSYPIISSTTSKTMDFYFCCRSDNAVDIPILLPNSKPFYLYRYQGTCQAVYNMQVTNEAIQIDTDDTKTDLFSNSYHADGTINNGLLELCYYTKKKSST